MCFSNNLGSTDVLSHEKRRSSSSSAAKKDVNVNLATLTRESSQNIFGIFFLVGKKKKMLLCYCLFPLREQRGMFDSAFISTPNGNFKIVQLHGVPYPMCIMNVEDEKEKISARMAIIESAQSIHHTKIFML